MNVKQAIALSRICGASADRAPLQYIRVMNGHAYATNGFVAARVTDPSLAEMDLWISPARLKMYKPSTLLGSSAAPWEQVAEQVDYMYPRVDQIFSEPTGAYSNHAEFSTNLLAKIAPVLSAFADTAGFAVTRDTRGIGPVDFYAEKNGVCIDMVLMPVKDGPRSAKALDYGNIDSAAKLEMQQLAYNQLEAQCDVLRDLLRKKDTELEELEARLAQPEPEPTPEPDPEPEPEPTPEPEPEPDPEPEPEPEPLAHVTLVSNGYNVWCYDATRADAPALKAQGFRWSPKRQGWWKRSA